MYFFPFEMNTIHRPSKINTNTKNIGYLFHSENSTYNTAKSLKQASALSLVLQDPVAVIKSIESGIPSLSESYKYFPFVGKRSYESIIPSLSLSMS